jgi:predicted phosphoribosyltransferase
MKRSSFQKSSFYYLRKIRSGIHFQNFGNMAFNNRQVAGEQLAELLAEYKGMDVLVMGVSPGGLEVACPISKALMAELSVIISKELAYPGNEEYSFGALCEQGTVYIDGPNHHTTDILVQKVIQKKQKEIRREIKLYRDGQELPDVKGRYVILVDDHLERGIGFVPAMKYCKDHKAAKIIIAVPVCGVCYDQHLFEADRLIFIQQSKVFSKADSHYAAPLLKPNELLALMKECGLQHRN